MQEIYVNLRREPRREEAWGRGTSAPEMVLSPTSFGARDGPLPTFFGVPDGSAPTNGEFMQAYPLWVCLHRDIAPTNGKLLFASRCKFTGNLSKTKIGLRTGILHTQNSCPQTFPLCRLENLTESPFGGHRAVPYAVVLNTPCCTWQFRRLPGQREPLRRRMRKPLP